MRWRLQNTRYPVKRAAVAPVHCGAPLCKPKSAAQQRANDNCSLPRLLDLGYGLYERPLRRCCAAQTWPYSRFRCHQHHSTRSVLSAGGAEEAPPRAVPIYCYEPALHDKWNEAGGTGHYPGPKSQAHRSLCTNHLLDHSLHSRAQSNTCMIGCLLAQVRVLTQLLHCSVSHRARWALLTRTRVARMGLLAAASPGPWLPSDNNPRLRLGLDEVALERYLEAHGRRLHLAGVGEQGSAFPRSTGTYMY
jgi:hypothetical protein